MYQEELVMTVNSILIDGIQYRAKWRLGIADHN